jgi:hypothetical protein
MRNLFTAVQGTNAAQQCVRAWKFQASATARLQCLRRPTADSKQTPVMYMRFATAARFTGTREIDRANRITPVPNLSAPIMSFVSHVRGRGALDLHGASRISLNHYGLYARVRLDSSTWVFYRLVCQRR